jgi:hypothetical protein
MEPTTSQGHWQARKPTNLMHQSQALAIVLQRPVLSNICNLVQQYWQSKIGLDIKTLRRHPRLQDMSSTPKNSRIHKRSTTSNSSHPHKAPIRIRKRTIIRSNAPQVSDMQPPNQRSQHPCPPAPVLPTGSSGAPSHLVQQPPMTNLSLVL